MYTLVAVPLALKFFFIRPHPPSQPYPHFMGGLACTLQFCSPSFAAQAVWTTCMRARVGRLPTCTCALAHGSGRTLG